MRLLVFLIILMAFGCVRPPPIELYRKLGDGVYTHQCNLPILFTIDSSVSETLYPVILNAFNYWDNLYKGDLFYYFDGHRLDEEIFNSGAIVVVKVIDRDNYLDKALASTYISRVYSKDGCMPNPVLKIRKDILMNRYGAIETVIRHEVGHILGFEDDYYVGDLMNGSLNIREIIEPKELSEWELKAFEIYYKR